MTDRTVSVLTTGGSRGIDSVRAGSELAQLFDLPIEVRSFVTDEHETSPRLAELERVIAAVESAVTITPIVEWTDDAGAAIAGLDDVAFSCMATSARLLPHDGHFGSYTERLLRSADHPVMVLGPKASSAVRSLARVIVPVDGSALAERALSVGADLAARMSADLWVLAVISPAQLAEAHAAGVSIETGYVRRLASPHHGQFDVLHGTDVADRLLEFAGADSLIVMSSHGRSGLDRLITGSVTMAVVADAKTPVVVVPPKFDIPQGGS